MGRSRKNSVTDLKLKAKEELTDFTLSAAKYAGLEVNQKAMEEIERLGAVDPSEQEDDTPDSDVDESSQSDSKLQGTPKTPVSVPSTPISQTDPFSDRESIMMSTSSLMMSSEEEGMLKKAEADTISKRYSDVEKRAFLTGYRMKQDYNNVLMGRQLQKLEEVAGRLGSNSHAVNAVVSNLSTGVSHVLLKLARTADALGDVSGSVREWSIDVSKASAPEEKKLVTQPAVASSSTAPVVTTPRLNIAEVLGSTPLPEPKKETPVSEPLKTLITENQVISAAALTGAPTWTVSEIEDVFTQEYGVILNFYELTPEGLLQIMSKFGKNKADAEKKHGDRLSPLILHELN